MDRCQFRQKYRLTLSILGDNILLVQPSGYATLHGVEKASRFINEVATEGIAGGLPYIQIVECSNLQVLSLEARKYFIDNIKRRERLMGLIFFGASPMLKMSIKLGRRLNILKFKVEIVNDYSEAVELALKMLSTAKTLPDDSLVNPRRQPLVVSEEEDKVCPVTGLPVLSRPEWRDIDLGEGYSVTFRFIGERTLLSIPRGNPGGCDDYIAKPFERETVIKKLEELGIGCKGGIQASLSKKMPLKTESSIVEDIYSRLKSGNINLPASSQIVMKFKEMTDRGLNLQEVTDLLKQDIAISSKLISVSNKVYYRGIAESRTLEQAIKRLGLSNTMSYVDVICNRSLYKTKSKQFIGIFEKLWEHSLSCAYVSQIVSEAIDLVPSNAIFTMGLLHDIGKLVLLQVLDELEIQGKLEEETDMVELFNTLDKLHGEFGAVLLKNWRFSNECVQIAMYHDNLEGPESVSKELQVVRFANLLVKSMAYDRVPQKEIDLEDVGVRLLGLNPTMIGEVKDQLNKCMESDKKSLFLGGSIGKSTL